MIQRLKAQIARHWPVLRLRTILFGTLLFVAALPGFSAVFLRVYENALVRRTEAELVSQSAALCAIAATLWPGAQPEAPTGPPRYQPTGIDLRASAILPERPAPLPAATLADPAALDMATRLAPAFAQTKQVTLSSILMLDGKGVILTGEDAGKSLATLPEIQRALSGVAVTRLRTNAAYDARYAFEWISRASNIRLHHARPIMVGGRPAGVILVSRSPRALFKGMYEDRGKIALGAGGIFLLLIALSAILSRAIVRPVENLSRATRALASGARIDPQVPSLEVVEIRDLFRDFDAMAQSIERRSRYLRDFAASVSHEFKTPLAGISGAIELLQDHSATMKPAERKQFLANMAADAERLSRLVKRLMELAQADMETPHGDARTAVGTVVARVADALRTARFAIMIDAPSSLSDAAIDPRALEAILTTITENARQAGATQVTVTASVTDRIIIDIADNGPGLTAGDAPRVFDPFFTSKRAEGGTGLGLPIAKSLAETYQGSLTLLPSPARGAAFRLTLPRSKPI